MSVIVLTSFIYKAADAQVRVNVSVNIGSQPDWGPSGYDYAEYYYLPDIDVYYHIPTRQYVYFENNRWFTVASLPSRYMNYDLYRGYKVVINESRPWLNNNTYRARYAGYRGRASQPLIRDHRDVRVVNSSYKPQTVHSRPAVISNKQSQPVRNERPARGYDNEAQARPGNAGNHSRGNDGGQSNTSRPQRRS